MTEHQPDSANPSAATARDPDLDRLSDDVSALPGLLGVLDLGIARLESFMLAAGVLLMAANPVANVIGRVFFESLPGPRVEVLPAGELADAIAPWVR